MQLGESAGCAPIVSHFTHNKLGGIPDWPSIFRNSFDLECKLCGVSRPLIVQCYAPFEKSPYHRILYVFACINPQCWNNPASWSCVRVQFKEVKDVKNEPHIIFKPTCDDWCDDADDWETENVDIYNNDGEGSMRKSDCLEIDMEEMILATENMSCSNVTSRLHELKERISATAEIEVDEHPNTSIDKPKSPQCNVTAILQEKPDIPEVLKENNKAVIHFMCEYITVYEEELSYNDDNHIKELLQRYESENTNDISALKNKGLNKHNDNCENEEYEKVIPLHGDIYFHSFLNKIKMNPKQIIRYGLGSQPLLISPFTNDLNQQKCANCSGKVQFEFQILPTIIPLLKLPGSNETHLEFGTVIIFTCKDSCWKENDNFVYETILLQREP